jgi:2-aminoadipate transaminase
VAYVPGREFFVEDRDNHDNCMRISFGGVEPEKIRIGMDRLAGVIKAKL